MLHSPTSPSWFKGLLLRGGEGRDGKREDKEGMGGRGIGVGGTGTGKWKRRGRDARERGGEGRKNERS